MKNWKKLLACLLVGLMALTVFTACDASVGAPMGAKRSNAESKSVKALCTRFGVTYDKELSEKLTILPTGSPAPRSPAGSRKRRSFTGMIM